jgi:hypothetical protein
MKKIFITIFGTIIFTVSADATVITGGVKYDINSAKDAVMTTQPPFLSSQLVKNNILDPNSNTNNSALLRGITELKDRTLAQFSDQSYGIIYKNNPTNVFYYNENGYLTHIELKDSVEYPYKAYKYNTFGNLINISLRTSEEETFIFNPSGKLIAHWVKSQCFDENNNVIMTRKIYK